uniref:Uncharacterized protein n=1 Tax=Anguilla anguilla TaxID=7936 RepID=A0A0E9W5X9_ANGAN
MALISFLTRFLNGPREAWPPEEFNDQKLRDWFAGYSSLYVASHRCCAHNSWYKCSSASEYNGEYRIV